MHCASPFSFFCLLSLLNIAFASDAFAQQVDSQPAESGANQTTIAQNVQAKDADPVPPQLLLAQMASAIKSTSYSGEFTYEHGSRLETYRLVHQVTEGRELESLQRLTGKNSLVSRSGDAGCGTIGRYLLAGARLASSEGDMYGLERFYHISTVGVDRIAGRQAWVVQLVPVDDYRFGLVLAIDRETYLLLRHVVFDARKKVALERIQFASLELGEVASATENATEVSSERCITDTYTPDGHSPWKPTWLPPGFILTGYEYHDKDGHMETYTDGVSSFSVFVKQGLDGSPEEDRIQQGVSSRGASMALITSRSLGGQPRQISVVGEIPLSAAQKISLSVRKASLEAREPSPNSEDS